MNTETKLLNQPTETEIETGINRILKPLTTKQFIWLLIGSGLSVTLWLAVHNGFRNLAHLPLCLSYLISMSPEERRRPLGRGETLAVILALVIIIGGGIALNMWFPSRFPKEPPRFLVNPTVILPLWLLFVWLVYRGWRLGKRQGDATA